MSGKAKLRYVVQCQKHGKESKDWAGKQVVVAQPKNKTEKYKLGCPECAVEARNT